MTLHVSHHAILRFALDLIRPITRSQPWRVICLCQRRPASQSMGMVSGVIVLLTWRVALLLRYIAVSQPEDEFHLNLNERSPFTWPCAEVGSWPLKLSPTPQSLAGR
jgi:hypothetical protein